MNNILDNIENEKIEYDHELSMADNFMEDDSLTEEQKDLKTYAEGVYNTDIGSLDPLPINEEYKNFKVSAPMKNGTYITYQVSGTRSDPNKTIIVGE